MGDKDFFLSPDDAQTMGNIEYMRTSKKTRRTFPKTLKNKDGFSFDNDVSSMDNRNKLPKNSNTNQNITENTVFNPTPSSQNQAGTGVSAAIQNSQDKTQYDFKPSLSAPAPAPTQQSPEKRRQSDSSMDMFRNMAKNIGKR